MTSSRWEIVEGGNESNLYVWVCVCVAPRWKLSFLFRMRRIRAWEPTWQIASMGREWCLSAASHRSVASWFYVTATGSTKQPAPRKRGVAVTSGVEHKTQYDSLCPPNKKRQMNLDSPARHVFNSWTTRRRADLCDQQISDCTVVIQFYYHLGISL